MEWHQPLATLSIYSESLYPYKQLCTESGRTILFKIDPSICSLIFQMRDYWQKSYNIDVNSPVIGVIEPKLVSKKKTLSISPSHFWNQTSCGSKAVGSLKATASVCVPTFWCLSERDSGGSGNAIHERRARPHAWASCSCSCSAIVFYVSRAP